MEDGGWRIPTDCEDARKELGAYSLWEAGTDWETSRLPGADDDPDWTVGLVVEELTGDGLLDVFVTGVEACMLFAGTPDGLLVDVSADWLPDGGRACGAWGAAAGDINGDDRLDLVLTGGEPLLRFWVHSGSGLVEASPVGSELKLVPHLRAPSFADMDLDGDLDLLVPGYLDANREPVPSLLLRNDGGTFVDTTAELLPPNALAGVTFLGSWFDADGDGDLDLYFVNDFGHAYEPNLLLLNTIDSGSPGFVAAPAESGLGISAWAMGNTVSDLNGDGRPDLFVSDIRTMHLLVSHGDEWVESAASRALWPDDERDQVVSWGGWFADLDNDGLEDLLVPFGPTETIETGEVVDSIAEEQPDAVFRQTADGHFEDVAPQWGLDQTINGRSTLAVDMDGDGWLDVFKREYKGGPTRLYRATPGCNRSLSIHLRGQPGNRQAIGAKVVVEAGDQSWTRWNLPTNTGLSVTGPPRVHIGIGRRESVDRVTVTFPSGRVQTIEAPPVGVPLVVEEGSSD